MSYIILDRDGVINHDSMHYIKNPDEWIPIPGSLEAVAQLNRFGFKVLIATNQSGVARGLYDIETLDQIHEKMVRELASVGGYVEEIFFCPHHPDEGCGCRKPKPGMIEQMCEKYQIDLPNTYFIGDTTADTGIAKAVGCKPVLVRTGKGEDTLKKNPELTSILNFADLSQAVDYILSK